MISYHFLFSVSFQEKPGNAKQVHTKITKALPRILDLLKAHQTEEIISDNSNETLPWNTFSKDVDPSQGFIFIINFFYMIKCPP